MIIVFYYKFKIKIISQNISKDCLDVQVSPFIPIKTVKSEKCSFIV